MCWFNIFHFRNITENLEEQILKFPEFLQSICYLREALLSLQPQHSRTGPKISAKITHHSPQSGAQGLFCFAPNNGWLTLCLSSSRFAWTGMLVVSFHFPDKKSNQFKDNEINLGTKTYEATNQCVPYLPHGMVLPKPHGQWSHITEILGRKLISRKTFLGMLSPLAAMNQPVEDMAVWFLLWQNQRWHLEGCLPPVRQGQSRICPLLL